MRKQGLNRLGLVKLVLLALSFVSTARAADSAGHVLNNGEVLVFEVKPGGIRAFKDRDGRIPVDLSAGDQIDMALPAFLSGPPSETEKTLGTEAYIKLAFNQAAPKGSLIEFSLRSSQDSALEGKAVFVPSSALDNVSLVDGTDDEGEDFEEPAAKPKCPQMGCAAPVAPAAKPKALSTLVASDFASYSRSPQVGRLIHLAEAHLYTIDYRGHRHLRYIRFVRRQGRLIRQGECYRAIKDALRAEGFVPRQFHGGGAAVMARTELLRYGFTDLLHNPKYKRLSESPEDAPRGALLVYSGTNHYGHIEIKTAPAGQEGYVSITNTATPAYGEWPTSRHLVAVLVKSL